HERRASNPSHRIELVQVRKSLIISRTESPIGTASVVANAFCSPLVQACVDRVEELRASGGAGERLVYVGQDGFSFFGARTNRKRVILAICLNAKLCVGPSCAIVGGLSTCAEQTCGEEEREEIFSTHQIPHG